MERAWLGIDIGTVGVRVAAHDTAGRPLASSTADRPPAHPTSGGMVHDPEADWWGGAREALGPVLEALADRPVGGVSLAGLFPAACLVDDTGRPLTEGILYGDTRAAGEIEPVEQALGVRLTGDEVVPRLRWIARTSPDLFARVRWVLGPTGYVALRLTGRPMVDANSAARWGGIAERGAWLEDRVATLGLPPSVLPPIHHPCALVGTVSGTAEATTGLPAGTPVVAGATDSFAALLGSGVRGPGDAMVYYGSSGTLLVGTGSFATAVTDAAAFAPESPFRLAAYAPSSGAFVERVRSQLLCGAGYDALDEEAAHVPPGANGVFVLPHVSGRMMPVLDPGARGAIVGLRLDHGRAHVWRATLESFGWLLMDAQRRLDAGLAWVVAGGGGARSVTWRSVLSDMTGLAQAVAPDGASARGASFLAALGTGAIGGIDAMRDRWLAGALDAAVTRPDDAAHERYLELLPGWLALDAALGGRTHGDPAP